ncbi:hypothetical protein [Lacinutrix himadriensis]|uniref:hypothetical protein n=1 Tax=Lacinutrix himadriensis TaxID=641549 RepID=UPI0006E186BB|nr:hypothetical protein [Lacinutrix himadriensis]
MGKLTLMILVIFYSSIHFYSQEKIELGTYLTENKLGYVTLLKNKKFGFVSYHVSSPYTTMEERKIKKIKKVLDGPSYIINEHGSGIYSFKNNKLKLEFIKPNHPIDSISIKETKTEYKSDSIEVKIIFKSYIAKKYDEDVGYINDIKSNNGRINYNTMFDNFAHFKISKNELPFNLTINENFPLTIRKKTSQEIELFINQFKKITTENLVDKIFEFEKLILLKTE